MVEAKELFSIAIIFHSRIARQYIYILVRSSVKSLRSSGIRYCLRGWGGVLYGKLSKVVKGLSYRRMTADVHTLGTLSYRAMDSPSAVPKTLKPSI